MQLFLTVVILIVFVLLIGGILYSETVTSNVNECSTREFDISNSNEQTVVQALILAAAVIIFNEA